MSAYGFGVATSPHIERLAGQGVLFAEAVAAAPWTGPAVASIVTGLYPDELGIHDLRDPLPDWADTVAERLRRQGWATGAVVSNAMAGPAYGHNQGYQEYFFERYKGDPDAGPQPPVFTADRVTDQALEWLSKARDPYFLYVHYTDPHEPYLAPQVWKHRLVGSETALDQNLLLDSRFTRHPLSDEQMETLRSYYDAEIAFVDHEIGRLLENLPPETRVVLTSDHGEELLDHGGFLHGHSLFQELLHVPLIIRGGGGAAGSTVDDVVSHVDIAPAILDLAGLPGAEEMTGSSLVRLLDRSKRAAPEGRVVFSVLENERNKCVSARRYSWKLIHCSKSDLNQLFDLNVDPEERQASSLGAPELQSTLRASIEQREARVRPRLQLDSPEQELERERELRAMGYIR